MALDKAAFVAFFKAYDKDKVGGVDALLGKYSGREEVVAQSLDKKYGCRWWEARARGVQIMGGGEVDQLLLKYKGKEVEAVSALEKKHGGGKPGSSSSDDTAKALTTFFKIFHPPSVPKAAQLASSYADRLPSLHTSLHQKYSTDFFTTRATLKSLQQRSPAAASTDVDSLLESRFRSTSGADLIAAFKKKYPPASPVTGDKPSYKQRLIAIYKAYCPEKLGKEGALLQKYKGHEDELIEAMVTRYGPEPQQVPDQKTVKVVEPGPELDWGKRIENLYKQHDPAKAGNARELTVKYAGKEPALWKQLVLKYGPESYWVNRLEKVVRHNKGSVPTDVVKKKLVEYAAREEELLALFVKKYGPEPVANTAGSKPRVSVAARVYRMYYQYNLEKIDSVKGLLTKYKGKEGDLYGALQDKYGKDAMNEQPAHDDFELRLVNLYCEKDPGGLQGVRGVLQGDKEQFLAQEVGRLGEEPWPPEPVNPHKARLERFYGKYNEEKLATADAALKKYEGHEEELFEALVKKYGPEPAEHVEDSDEVKLIKYYYMQHKPYEYCNIPAVLQEWDGREPELVKVLEQSFGDVEELNPYARRITADIEEEHANHEIPSVVNHEERCMRWKVMEDQDVIRGDLALIEADERITAKQVEIERVLVAKTREEHLKIVFRRWVAFLAGRILNDCEKGDEILKRLPVYRQLQTNKWSMAADLRRQKSKVKKGSNSVRRVSEGGSGGMSGSPGRFAKSTAELRLLYEENKKERSTMQSVTLAGRGTPSKPLPSPARTPGKQIPSPPRSPSPRRPTLYQTQASRIQAAHNTVLSTYPSPDADFFSSTLQHVTGTPETSVEAEMRLRRQRALGEIY